MYPSDARLSCCRRACTLSRPRIRVPAALRARQRFLAFSAENVQVRGIILAPEPRGRTFRGGKREAGEALAKLVTQVSGGSHAAQDATVGALLREWPALAKPELSQTTARQVHAILRCTPSFGVRHPSACAPAGGPVGWIGTNPAAPASPPRVRSRQLAAPEPDGVVKLIDRAEADDPDSACCLLLAATTGARRGEWCAALVGLGPPRQGAHHRPFDRRGGARQARGEGHEDPRGPTHRARCRDR